jgi:cytochrome c biogenesis protein CcmG, thiol:disulfide interchange protein DsbE
MNRYWNIFSAVVLVVGAAWMALSIPAEGSVTEGRAPAPRQGFLAPDFELQDAQGRPVHLSELRGRPVLVNFWASWCPPCQAEMPAMQAVHEAYGEQYVILAVNTTYQDSETDALRFIQQKGLTFPVLFDRDGATSRRYEVRAMPTSFFIDSEGIIQEVVVGGPMSEGLLRSQAERMIGER